MGPVLLVLGMIHLSWARSAAGQELLNRSISITVQEKSLKSVLHLIEKQAEIKFSYSPQVVPIQQRVTLNVDNRSLGDVLPAVAWITTPRIPCTGSKRRLLARLALNQSMSWTTVSASALRGGRVLPFRSRI